MRWRQMSQRWPTLLSSEKEKQARQSSQQGALPKCCAVSLSANVHLP